MVRVHLATPILLAVLTGLLLPAGSVRADAGSGDGVYGRFASDFTVSAGLGGGYQRGAEGGGVFVGELRLRHLDAAGPFVAGQWGPGVNGALMTGIELRPLFPVLFLQNVFSGREYLDLMLQSVGVELGAAYAPIGAEPGWSFLLGFGIEAPILKPSRWAGGTWLRVGARHLRGSSIDRGGPGSSHSDWVFYVTLSVKALLDFGIVGREPARYRSP